MIPTEILKVRYGRASALIYQVLLSGLVDAATEGRSMDVQVILRQAMVALQSSDPERDLPELFDAALAKLNEINNGTPGDMEALLEFFAERQGVPSGQTVS